MQANTEQFQAIYVGAKSNANITSVKVSNKEIQREHEVKLLGIDNDHLLSFDSKVTHLCRKAAKHKVSYNGTQFFFND